MQSGFYSVEVMVPGELVLIGSSDERINVLVFSSF